MVSALRVGLLANGQLLPINQYQALFALLGTQFGGNGVNNFALPDLRGRAPVGAGNGAGLAPVVVGEIGGAETVTLSTNNFPAHSHGANTTATINAKLNAVSGQGNSASPAGNVPALSSARDNVYSSLAPATAMAGGALTSTVKAGTTLGNAGSSTPVLTLPIRSPYLAVTYCIAASGIFPARN